MNKKFVAIDGALNNFGIATGTITGNKLRIQAIKNVSTTSTKTDTRLNDARRGRVIAKVLDSTIRDADIIFAELPGGSRNARAAWSLGFALGLIVSLNKPIQFVTVREVKNVTGSVTAKKQEIIDWAVKRYPNLKWYRRGNRITIKNNEHMADAIAVAVAAFTNYGNKGFIK